MNGLFRPARRSKIGICAVREHPDPVSLKILQEEVIVISEYDQPPVSGPWDFIPRSIIQPGSPRCALAGHVLCIAICIGAVAFPRPLPLRPGERPHLPPIESLSSNRSQGK